MYDHFEVLVCITLTPSKIVIAVTYNYDNYYTAKECENCMEPATIYCSECSNHYCMACSDRRHQHPKRRCHRLVALCKGGEITLAKPTESRNGKPSILL